MGHSDKQRKRSTSVLQKYIITSSSQLNGYLLYIYLYKTTVVLKVDTYIITSITECLIGKL